MKKLILFVMAALLTVPLFAETFTVTKTSEELATEFSWVNGTAYPSFQLNKVVKVAAVDDPKETNRNGMYYSDWRLYQARFSGEFSISVAVGYQLKSITLTYGNKYNGVVGLVSGSSIETKNQVTSDTKLTLGARVFSKTLYSANTGTATNGQTKITKFSVEYESIPVDTLYLNTGGSDFWNQAGAKFSAYYWNDGELGHFTDFLEPAFGEIDIYRAIIPHSDSVIFVRHDAAADVPTWDNKWNQTDGEKVDLEDNGNIMVITGWNQENFEWDHYTPKEEKFYVTGDSLLLDGRTEKAKWAADAIEMVDGSYTFTNLAVGDYQMKVTQGDWNSTSYGYGALSKSSSANIYDKDGNIRFIVATPGDVKVDYAAGEVTVTGNFAPISTTYNVEVPKGTPNCFIAGSFNGWTFQQMNMVDSTNYTLTLVGELQDSVYKYTCGKDWKYVEDIAENRTYKVNDKVEAWKKVLGATYADTYTNGIDLPKIEGKVYDAKVVCYGDTFPAVKVGTGTTGTRVSSVTVPAGTKNLHLHIAGWSGKTVKVTATVGESELAQLNVLSDNVVSGSATTYVLDGEKFYLTIAVNATEDTVITLTGDERYVLFGVNAEGGYEAPKYFIAGNMTQWADNMVELTLAEEDSLYRANIALEADSLYAYKIVSVQSTDTAWYGLDGAATMTSDNCTGWWIYKSEGDKNQSNIGLQTTKAADYAFAVDVRDIANKAVVSVTIPKRGYTYDTLYTIAGNFTNWASDMQAMPYEVKNVAKDSVLLYKVVRQLITYEDGIETKRDTTWLGQPNEGNQMTRESNAWKLDGGSNVKLTADEAGTYKFDFTPADSVLTVTFPALKPYLDSVNTIAHLKACYEAGTLKDLDTIKVKGYITKITVKPSNFAKYGSAIVWMTDTLGGTTSEFELYNCFGLEKDTFAYFGPGYNTTGKLTIDIDTIIGRNNVRFVIGDYIEAVGAFKNFSGTFELNQGCNIYEGGEKMVRYAKNNWETSDWTWEEMTYVPQKNQFELNKVVYGGTGLNINTVAADADAVWIAEAAFLGDKVQAKDTVSFVFNPTDSTLTATLVGRPAPQAKVYYITGNKALVGEDLEWNTKAITMKDSIHTFMAMAAGDYKIKVTDGTWANSWGYANLSESSSEGISNDADGNICFTVETANNVVVSIANGVVTVTGNFKKSQPTTPSYGLLVNGEYYAGVPNDIEGGKEYKVEIVLYKDDEVQLFDSINKAGWIVQPEGSGYTDFTKDFDGQKYTITNDGTYQFYVKIYTNATSGLYVGYTQDIATGLNEWQINTIECTKVLINGQLMIIRNGTYYHANGLRVQ